MFKVQLSDFSLKSNIISDYCRSNNQNRNNFNIDLFWHWVPIKYDLNDPKNYVLTYKNILTETINKNNYFNTFGQNLIQLIKKETGISVTNESSLTGLLIPIESAIDIPESYSVNDLHKTCILLAASGIITIELKEILQRLNSKYGNIIVTNQDKQQFINGLKKSA